VVQTHRRDHHDHGDRVCRVVASPARFEQVGRQRADGDQGCQCPCVERQEQQVYEAHCTVQGGGAESAYPRRRIIRPRVRAGSSWLARRVRPPALTGSSALRRA
jgi:hypothetical protein